MKNCAKLSARQEKRSPFILMPGWFCLITCIVCGVTIGEFAFIGAGAVINKDVKPYALMVGVPAKQIGWMSEYGEKLDLPLEGNAETICPYTNQKYSLKSGKILISKT